MGFIQSMVLWSQETDLHPPTYSALSLGCGGDLNIILIILDLHHFWWNLSLPRNGTKAGAVITTHHSWTFWFCLWMVLFSALNLFGYYTVCWFCFINYMALRIVWKEVYRGSGGCLSVFQHQEICGINSLPQFLMVWSKMWDTWLTSRVDVSDNTFHAFFHSLQS